MSAVLTTDEWTLFLVAMGLVIVVILLWLWP